MKEQLRWDFSCWREKSHRCQFLGIQVTRHKEVQNKEESPKLSWREGLLDWEKREDERDGESEMREREIRVNLSWDQRNNHWTEIRDEMRWTFLYEHYKITKKKNRFIAAFLKRGCSSKKCGYRSIWAIPAFSIAAFSITSRWIVCVFF